MRNFVSKHKQNIEEYNDNSLQTSLIEIEQEHKIMRPMYLRSRQNSTSSGEIVVLPAKSPSQNITKGKNR